MRNWYIVTAATSLILIIPFLILSVRTGSKKVGDADRKKYLIAFVIVSLLMFLFAVLAILFRELSENNRAFGVALRYAFARTSGDSVSRFIVIAITIYLYWIRTKK